MSTVIAGARCNNAPWYAPGTGWTTELATLERDLLAAERLSRPETPPRRVGVQVGVHYRPLHRVGGDFYDWTAWPNERKVLFALGDVAGKGIPACLLMSSLRATLRVLFNEELPPRVALGKANQLLGHWMRAGRFASVFCAALDLGANALTYANAGHPPALLRHADGSWEELGPTGPVLCAFGGATTGRRQSPEQAAAAAEDSLYAEQRCRFEPGELLVLYTDGATEAEGPAGESFGLARLTSAVERWLSLSPQSLVDNIAAEIEAFAPGVPSDDRTLLVVARSEENFRPLP